MKAMTLDEVLAAFDPVDRPEVTEPQLHWVPWGELDYFAWRHPTEPKAFLVAQLPERSVGIVLKTSPVTRAGLCDLCYGIDRMGGTMMATAESWARPRTKHGVHMCASLDCSDSARGVKWVYRMGETIPVGRRVERLQENLEGFLRSVTGLRVAGKRA